MQSMRAQYPCITWLYDRLPRQSFWNSVFGGEGRFVQLQSFVEDQFDLGHLEAGDLNLETHIDEGLQFDRKNFSIPTCFFGNSIVRQNIRTLVGIAEMVES